MEYVMQVTKGEDGRYYKPCPECNVMQSYLRKNYAEESLRLNKTCKSCSNKKTDNCHRGWHRGVRVSWFNKFKASAETRGIEWDLSMDYVANLMEQQSSKCALTGWSIEFPESGHPQKALASIDRVDSSKGYLEGNVQLVTRHVNMMKQQYTQEQFIEVCKAVAEKW
jgi:hypothetical protein